MPLLNPYNFGKIYRVKLCGFLMCVKYYNFLQIIL